MKTDLPCSSAALLHPVTLLALALWAINDHLLKAWGPGLLTGKLSDVAGLVVSPTVLLGILEWCAPGALRRHRDVALAASCGAVGLLLVGLELSKPVELAYQHALGSAQFFAGHLFATLSADRAPAYVLVRTTPDVTDLLTLPALAIPWWLVRSRRGTGAARPSEPGAALGSLPSQTAQCPDLTITKASSPARQATATASGIRGSGRWPRPPAGRALRRARC